MRKGYGWGDPKRQGVHTERTFARKREKEKEITKPRRKKKTIKEEGKEKDSGGWTTSLNAFRGFTGKMTVSS